MKKYINRNKMNESFSSWCDKNVPHFDLVGFTSNMIGIFDVFNKLYEMDEAVKFRFIIYDEEHHKEVLYEYPGDNALVSPEKNAQYFSELLKSKLGVRPDELAKNMKQTCMCIEINPNRYFYNYIQSYMDISSGQKIYLDDSHDYYCLLHESDSTGKVNIYILTANFMENPDVFIEFFS